MSFRCSTCGHEKPLKLRERPLIAMDATFLVPQYRALRPEQVLEWIERLASTCRRFGGAFSLLWHNTSLIEPWQRELYLEVLEVAVK